MNDEVTLSTTLVNELGEEKVTIKRRALLANLNMHTVISERLATKLGMTCDGVVNVENGVFANSSHQLYLPSRHMTIEHPGIPGGRVNTAPLINKSNAFYDIILGGNWLFFISNHAMQMQQALVVGKASPGPGFNPDLLEGYMGHNTRVPKEVMTKLENILKQSERRFAHATATAAAVAIARVPAPVLVPAVTVPASTTAPGLSNAPKKPAADTEEPEGDYLLKFDGACRGNPGLAAGAAILWEWRRDCGKTTRVWEDGQFYGNGCTNNETEYRALLLGLEECVRRKLGSRRHSVGINNSGRNVNSNKSKGNNKLHNHNSSTNSNSNDDDRCSLRVQGDSELIIKQLRGEYKVKSPVLKIHYTRAIELLQQLRSGNGREWSGCSVELEWIPREENRDADKLAYQRIEFEDIMNNTSMGDATMLDIPDFSEYVANPPSFYSPSSASPSSAPCACCRYAVGMFQCAGCMSVRYCSQACQKQHWCIHKKECENKRNKRQKPC